MKLTLNKTLKLAIIASLCTAPPMAEDSTPVSGTYIGKFSDIPNSGSTDYVPVETDATTFIMNMAGGKSTTNCYLPNIKGSTYEYIQDIYVIQMDINNGWSSASDETTYIFSGTIYDGSGVTYSDGDEGTTTYSGNGNITYYNFNSSANKFVFSFTGDVSNFSGDIISTEGQLTTDYAGGLSLIFATTDTDSFDAASGTGTINLTGTSSEYVTYSYSSEYEVTIANMSITAPVINFEGGADYDVNSPVTATSSVNIKDGSSLSLTDTLTTDGEDGAEATTATTDYSITVGDVTVTGGTLENNSNTTGSITTSEISNLDLSNTAIVSTNNDGLTLSDVTVTASTLSLTADADSSGDLTLTLSNVTLDNTKLTLNASSTVIKATNLTVIETVTALTVVDVATPTTFTTLTDTDVSTDTTTGSVVISLDSLSSDLVILDGYFTITLDMSDELYAELDRLINEEYYSFTIAIENIDSSTAEILGDLSVSINGISYDYVAGYGASYDSENGTLSFRLVPEPSTASLSLLALAGLVARRRRKA